MLLQHFSTALVFVSYQLNRAYIAANLCVNRNKPAMHCNGQCHLRKQLQREEQQEQKNPYAQKESKEVILFCETHHRQLQVPFREINNTYTSFYLIKPTHHPLNGIFHPPAVSAAA